MQQCCESCALVPPCSLVDPRKIRRQGDPTLRPDPGVLRGSPSGRPLPPHTSFPSAASSVLLVDPTPDLSSAQRFSSPSRSAPIGDHTDGPGRASGFRRRPFVRDAVHDPGGASPSRLTTMHTRPSTDRTVSASATFHLSGLTIRTPHDPCLRFRPRVAATPARLGSDPARYSSGRSGLPPVCLRQLHPSALGQLVENHLASVSLRLVTKETGIISPATCELDRYDIKCASVVSAACT